VEAGIRAPSSAFARRSRALRPLAGGRARAAEAERASDLLRAVTKPEVERRLRHCEASTPARKGGATAPSTSMRPGRSRGSSRVRRRSCFEEASTPSAVDVRRGNGVSLVLLGRLCSRVFPTNGARVEQRSAAQARSGRPRSPRAAMPPPSTSLYTGEEKKRCGRRRHRPARLRGRPFWLERGACSTRAPSSNTRLHAARGNTRDTPFPRRTSTHSA